MKIKKYLNNQIVSILALVTFIFINVIIFKNWLNHGYTIFSVMMIFGVGLLSHKKTLRNLAILSFILNVVIAFWRLNYIGWFTGLVAILLIYCLWYLFPESKFFSRINDARNLFGHRRKVILLTAIKISLIWLIYLVVSFMVNDSFIEYAANTLTTFIGLVILFKSLLAGRKIPEIGHEISEKKELFTQKNEQASYSLSDIDQNLFVKVFGIWLMVMDLSILSYVFKPNDVGFHYAAAIVVVTILITFMVHTEENKTNVFSIIYHQIKPFQTLFFLILFIAHTDKFSYGIAYVTLAVLVLIVWLKKWINVKTALTLLMLIYLMPVVGYFSNPYRLGATNNQEVGKTIFSTGRMNYRPLYNWMPFFNEPNTVNIEDDYEEPSSRNYYRYVKLDRKNSKINLGSYDDISKKEPLTINIKPNGNILVIDNKGHEKHFIKNLDEIKKEVIESQSDKVTEINSKVYKDYYKVDDLLIKDGVYHLYLKMSDQWIESYQSEILKNNKLPIDFSYEFVITGHEPDIKEIGYYVDMHQ